MSTQRKCRVWLVNSTGEVITDVTFTHRNGRNDWTDHYARIDPNDSLGPREVTYYTGLGSPTDHWHVIFVDSKNDRWDNDPDFDCSPDADEEGKDIRVIITSQKL